MATEQAGWCVQSDAGMALRLNRGKRIVGTRTTYAAAGTLTHPSGPTNTYARVLVVSGDDPLTPTEVAARFWELIRLEWADEDRPFTQWQRSTGVAFEATIIKTSI